MAKQIMISNGDSGILIDVQLVDSLKVPIDLTSSTLTIYLVDPDGNKKTLLDKNIAIEDYVLGKVGITLTSEETSVSGVYNIYIQVNNSDFSVSSVQSVVYVVLDKNGGA